MQTEDLSTAQRLQMAAMFTDALSNLIDRSRHLCDTHDAKTVSHQTLLRNTVDLTAATLAETVQALLATSVKVETGAGMLGALEAIPSAQRGKDEPV